MKSGFFSVGPCGFCGRCFMAGCRAVLFVLSFLMPGAVAGNMAHAQSQSIRLELLDQDSQKRYLGLRKQLDDSEAAYMAAKQKAYQEDQLLERSIDGIKAVQDLGYKEGQLRQKVKEYTEQLGRDDKERFQKWQLLRSLVEGPLELDRLATDPCLASDGTGIFPFRR